MDSSPSSRRGNVRSPSDNARRHARMLLYKSSTPPWREAQKQRLRGRIQDSRERLLLRFRQSSQQLPAADAPLDEQLLASWEQLEREMVAEETESLLDTALADGSVITDWSVIAEELLKETIVCPLCESSAVEPTLRTLAGHTTDDSAICGQRYWLQCPCGLSVTTCVSDPVEIRGRLESAVERHRVLCSQADAFFTQQSGQLIVLCAACGDRCSPLLD